MVPAAETVHAPALDALSATPETRAPESPPPTAAPAEPTAPSTASTAAPAQPAPALDGTLKAKAGARVTVELPDAELPSVGQKGTLLRRFTQDLGILKATGWLAIADVSVVEVRGRQVVLTVDAETSEMNVNGRKVNHFQPGQPIRLELAAR